MLCFTRTDLHGLKVESFASCRPMHPPATGDPHKPVTLSHVFLLNFAVVNSLSRKTDDKQITNYAQLFPSFFVLESRKLQVTPV